MYNCKTYANFYNYLSSKIKNFLNIPRMTIFRDIYDRSKCGSSRPLLGLHHESKLTIYLASHMHNSATTSSRHPRRRREDGFSLSFNNSCDDSLNKIGDNWRRD